MIETGVEANRTLTAQCSYAGFDAKRLLREALPAM